MNIITENDSSYCSNNTSISIDVLKFENQIVSILSEILKSNSRITEQIIKEPMKKDIVQINIKNREIRMISDDQLIPSQYRYSDNYYAEQSSIDSLRRKFGGRKDDIYTVNIWYGPGLDTQFGASETPKRGERNAKDVVERLVKEEMCIIAPKVLFKEFGPITFFKRKRKITQPFLLDLTDRENLRKVRSGKFLQFSKVIDDPTACRAHVIIIGTKDQLIKLLENAKPNDNIGGYHLIPINSHSLDKIVNR